MERLGPLWRQPYTGTDFLAASRERMRALQARPCRFACAEPLRRRSAAIDRMRSFAKEPVNRQPDVLVGHDGGRRRAEPSGRQPDGRDQLECSDGAKAAGTGASVNSQSSRGRRHGVLLVLASLSSLSLAGRSTAGPSH
jgi:hypothetical protein